MTIARSGAYRVGFVLAVWLGIGALVIRIFTAPGLMPDPAALANGEFELVICTSSGLKIVDAALPDPAGEPGRDGGDPCVYAAFGALADISERQALAHAVFKPASEMPGYQTMAVAALLGPKSVRAPPAIS